MDLSRVDTEVSKYRNVKRYKRGAKWPNGTPRYCVRCQVEGRRRNQATVLAERKGKFTLSVGYCTNHTPDELREESG